MTAHPVTCIVDYEDGVRTVITLEEPSDVDAEQGAIARLRVTTDDYKMITVGLSPEAVEVLERRLLELRLGAQREPDETPGVAGNRCTSGNECGRLGCPECQD
jgi:hypothetical protein